jgi:hypothetical protein
VKHRQPRSTVKTTVIREMTTGAIYFYSRIIRTIESESEKLTAATRSLLLLGMSLPSRLIFDRSFALELCGSVLVALPSLPYRPELRIPNCP